MSLCPLGRSKDVSWSLTSKKDPRWNKEGIDTVGMMFDTANTAKKWINLCKKKYGKVPKDLVYSANKE